MRGIEPVSVLKARCIHDFVGGRHRSLAIHNGRVVATSDDPDALDGLASSPADVQDAGDITFVPGFFDAHTHFLFAALSRQQGISMAEVRAMGGFPAVSQDDRIAAIEDLGRDFARLGVTTVRDVGVQRPEMLAYHLARRAGRLPVRARVLLRLDPRLSAADKIAELDAWPVSSGFGDDRLRVDAAILVADQPVDAAATTAGYATDPDYRGSLHASDEDMAEVVSAAVDRGWRVTCSAAGDRAVEQVLTVYEAEIAKRPELPAGWFGIEHAMLATPAQQARVRAAGIAVTLQSSAVYAIAADMRKHWGPESAARAVPVADWLRADALLAAGSLYDAGPANPLASVWMMATRRTAEGDILGPEQAVTREQALYLWTVGGRRAFDGLRGGPLAPGQSVDLAGYHVDPLDCDLDDLPELTPTLTLLAGERV